MSMTKDEEDQIVESYEELRRAIESDSADVPARLADLEAVYPASRGLVSQFPTVTDRMGWVNFLGSLLAEKIGQEPMRRSIVRMDVRNQLLRGIDRTPEQLAASISKPVEAVTEALAFLEGRGKVRRDGDQWFLA